MPPIDRDRYYTTRRHLDMLGYQYVFPPDCLLLVEKLVSDIINLKERIEVCEKYLNAAREENKDLLNSLEPFKLDNRRLATEYENLKKKSTALREKFKNETISLKEENGVLQEQLADLKFVYKRALEKLKILEKENPKENEEKIESVPVALRAGEVESAEFHLREKIKKKEMGEAADHRAGALGNQMEILRKDNCKLSNIVVTLKRQLKEKDVEILRLKTALDSGKSLTAIRQDCCCKCQQKDTIMRNLEQQLQETVDKQHEAMTRALQLAERNQLLEKELKDMGEMATAFEEKRDTRQKEFDVMQERLNTAQREIKDLEIRLKDERERHEGETKMAEKLRREKRTLENDLGTAVNEKKSLNDKINQFVITEKELKDEVEKLRAANQTLHRRWTEKDTWRDCKDSNCRSNICPCKCPSPPRKRTGSPPWKSKRLKDKTEPKICGCAPNLMLLDKLQQERDYYHKECHLLREQICKNHGCGQMPEKDTLSMRNSVVEESWKLLLERVERERDVALADLRRAQEERDHFKERIKVSVDSHSDHSRLERMLSDVVSGQGMGRTSLTALERQCDEYRNQLRACQAELSQVNALYSQLKSLHEQTDRSFSGTQGRILQLETELAITNNKARDFEKVKWELEEKMALLSREKSTMLQNLATLEKEKDELTVILDDKTERVVRMEAELRRRDTQIAESVEQIAQAQKKFDAAVSEKTTKDHAYRTLELTLERVKQDLQQVTAEVEALRSENLQLKDDLSAALRDGHMAHKDVEVCRQENANLKRQLQQYVTEVKRAEELISKKEREQNEMLNTFHTLSLEASSLENSNHTLESEVQVSRNMVEDLSRQVQSLEAEVMTKNDLVAGCEKQIASLSTQIVELEGQLTNETRMRNRSQMELRTLSEGQKKSQHILAAEDEERAALTREVRRLSEECDGLNNALSRERAESSALKESLNHSRQETLKHQMSNKDLTTLIHQLRRKVEQLTEKQDAESENVRRYQEQCTDLNQVVSELRREFTNVKSDSSKGSDRTRWINENDLVDTPEISRRNLPPLPLPPASDLSSVSSDMYFSIGDSDFEVCGGTYRVFSDKSSSFSPSDDAHTPLQCRLSDIVENSQSFDSSFLEDNRDN